MSSQLMLVQPSAVEFHRIEQCIAAAGSNDYDMEIVNNLYRDSAFILPHRPYNLVTGEFRSKNHTSYLGNPQELWDPVEVLREAKFLHFSDWPVPKVCCSVRLSLPTNQSVAVDTSARDGDCGKATRL